MRGGLRGRPVRASRTSGALRGAAFVLLALTAAVALPGAASAQGGAGDRNKAQPYFETARQTTVTSFAALNSWAGALLKDVERPAALFYGNAPLAPSQMGDVQNAQLGVATSLILYGGPEDRWIADKVPTAKAGKYPVVRLHDLSDAPNGHYRFYWTDITRARADVKVLAKELATLHKGRAADIQKNADAYDAELAKLEAQMEKLLSPHKGAQVYLVSPGLEPFLERFGIGVAGYLSNSTDREPTPQEYERFRKELSEAHNPVLLRYPGALPIPLLRMTLEVPMRSVLIDPMTSGEPDPGHYVTQMRQNAVNLALALRAAKEIAAAFTPAPTPVPGAKPEGEDEPLHPLAEDDPEE